MDRLLIPSRMLPLNGHKSSGMRIKFEVNCECGWYSCPQSSRSEAWSEWRTHVRDCGGVEEPREETMKRQKRQIERATPREP